MPVAESNTWHEGVARHCVGSTNLCARTAPLTARRARWRRWARLAPAAFSHSTRTHMASELEDIAENIQRAQDLYAKQDQGANAAAPAEPSSSYQIVERTPAQVPAAGRAPLHTPVTEARPSRFLRSD